MPILLNKLLNYGIRGTALNWFSSYLSRRKQSIRIGNELSRVKTIEFGVPQGSILGPTLFSLYINDIFTVPVINAEIICYADDTALIFYDMTWNQALQRGEDGMRLISQWLNSNLLTLNMAKTKYLCFHKTKISAPSNVDGLKIHTCKEDLEDSCKCGTILRADSLRYLGIVLDENLNFKLHIALTSGRVRKVINIMRNLRGSADGKTLRTVYFALCQSIINYCILAWGGAAQTSLISLERAQRGVLKTALFKPMLFSTTALYEEAGVLSVRKLFIAKAVTYTHKEIILSQGYQKLLNKRVFKLPTPSFNTSFAHRFGSFLLPHIYNKFIKIVDLKNKSVHETKVHVSKMLQHWTYDETEKFLRSYY